MIEGVLLVKLICLRTRRLPAVDSGTGTRLAPGYAVQCLLPCQSQDFVHTLMANIQLKAL